MTHAPDIGRVLTLDIGQPQRDRTTDAALGFDWGVETFLTGVDHAGEVVLLDNPRWWRSEKGRITGLQQAVSRQENRRSNRRRKAVRRLAAARAKTARRRLDWAHQQTVRLAWQYALVATEGLRIARMTRSAAGTMWKSPAEEWLRKRP
jgi:putative transposase